MDLVSILQLSKELGGVPIIHLATDMNTKMVEVFGAHQPIYPFFRLGLPFDVEESLQTIQPLAREQAFFSGYPVRPSFLRPPMGESERAAERQRRDIPRDACVVLVMSGDGGYDTPWPEQLANSATQSTPLHLIVVAGADWRFGERLERVLPGRERRGRRLFLRGTSPLVTVEVARDPGRQVQSSKGTRAFYVQEEELTNLMDISDVILTKPGGSTTSEAAYRGLPLLFDATNGLLHWEAFTVDTFEAHGRGKRLNYYLELEDGIKAATSLKRSRALVLERNTSAFLDPSLRVREMVDSLMLKRYG